MKFRGGEFSTGMATCTFAHSTRNRTMSKKNQPRKGLPSNEKKVRSPIHLYLQPSMDFGGKVLEDVSKSILDLGRRNPV